MIAALRTTLATVLVVLGCWFAPTATTTATATAASTPAECDPLDLDNPTAVREHADAVTDVFAGKVSDVEPRTSVGGGEGKANQGDEPSDGSSDGPTGAPDTPDRRITRWQHTVVVDIPFRSELQPGNRVLVVTEPSGEPGGLGRLDVKATYVFFVSGEQGMNHLIAERCGGTTKVGALSAEQRDRLAEALDEQTTEETAPDYSLSPPDDGARSNPSLGRLAAPGAALALIGVLGLLLLARINSRRA
ncbi:hypothetical protein [Nocardioides bizhenqiangii]|uniref:Sortase n=1 Tax=Nocardioides bizhenqiangii TaxID=3095076 RepID=A0ABZ0ZRJ1_9ACTN|nr:hypothetical protein [Nocardioides sp. HM61]WQQ26399.1 hypothetical protein SHK19_20890 [Nocardioides sp. HM61]